MTTVRPIPWRIVPERAALLVIDMQNAFLEVGGPLEIPMARECVPRIKKLATFCRSLNIPVIYTQASHFNETGVMVSPLELAYQPELEGKLIAPGTHAHEFYAELNPAEGDIVIPKYRFDSFYNTELDTLLNTIRFPVALDTVIITGTVTNICCESTARSAFMRDYKVVFSSDGTGGLDQESQQATLNIIGRCFGRVMSVEEIIAEMQSTTQK